MLAREGMAPGPNLNLEVFEFGPINGSRHPSDILPYLPAFRHLFSPLSTEPNEMVLKTYKIPLEDLECVTSTVLKIGGPTWYLNIKKGKREPTFLIATLIGLIHLFFLFLLACY